MFRRSDADLRDDMAVELTAFELLQARMVGQIDRLPKLVKLGLSGQRQIKIEGNKLDPTIQALAAVQKRLYGAGFTNGSVQKIRQNMRRDSAIAAGAPIKVADVRELSIQGPTGAIKARHYLPLGVSGPRPLLVFFHGGGFVLGDLDTHDAPCRLFCNRAKINVLSIDYRLAPEYKAPFAAEDCFAAYKWAVENADSLGVDRERIAVGGDSAGGNLSAVTCLKARDQGFKLPVLQFLIYPGTDAQGEYASQRTFAEGFFLTQEDVNYFRDAYVANDEAKKDPYVSPQLATTLEGLPPALIATAGFDPIRDQGLAYRDTLAEAGVKVEHVQYDSLTHGFVNLLGIGGEAKRASEELAMMLRLLIGR